MASTYLTRTSDTATNVNKYTFSAWIKRSLLTSGFQPIFGGTGSTLANYHDSLFFKNSTDNFVYQGATSGSTEINLQTSASYRDVSAWYHVVVAYDSTQSTASDRVKIYVNGVQETSFSTATYPSQNRGAYANGRDSSTITISKIQSDAVYFDGSMAHVHFIDGTAYDADTFGETDATTGIWKPKTAPSVTYGTNGFFLKFENSGAMGTDSSGNANNFTVNGTMTQTIDTPSNVFATMNPLDQTIVGGSSATMTDGNLTWQSSSNNTSQNGMRGTLGLTQGKWYWEVKYIAKSSGNDDFSIGICGSEANLNVGGSGDILEGANPNVMWLTRNDNSSVKKNSSDVTTGLTDANIGDIIMLAVDMDNLKFFVGINGTWLNSANPVTGANAPSTIDANTYLPAVSNFGYSYARTLSFNFGNGYFGTTAVSSAQNPDDGIGIFEYAVPTGYKALCTKSINAQEYD